MAELILLPTEIFTHHILLHADVQDLMSLASTCSTFHEILEDESLWRRRLEQDFGFSLPADLTRGGYGSKSIYAGLYRSEIHIWGFGSGVPGTSQTSGPLQYPIRVDIPGARIVSIATGGWSFHALDSQGQVHVWGVLDGEAQYHNVPLYGHGQQATGRLFDSGTFVPISQPLRLNLLGTRIRRMSCGRKHTALLDESNQIWHMQNWGRPFKMTSPLLKGSSGLDAPKQIECGWYFTCVLTTSSDVFVWFPWETAFQLATIGSVRPIVDFIGPRPCPNVIPCEIIELDMQPARLPPLPTLPPLCHGKDLAVQIVQLAGCDRYLFALTNQGHVVKFGPLGDSVSVAAGRWTYVSFFACSHEASLRQNLLSLKALH